VQVNYPKKETGHSRNSYQAPISYLLIVLFFLIAEHSHVPPLMSEIFLMSLPSLNRVPSGPTILLVEDEVLVATELRYALESEGFIVSGTSSSAAEAIESCLARRPDIAVVDIRLKGNIDGIDTASALRNQFSIPIIFLTAHAAHEDLERAEKVEPVGFVMKPVVFPELVASLKLGIVKHEAERKLRASERRLSTILRCLSDAVIVVNNRGTVNFINQAGLRLLNTESEQILGKLLSEVISVVHPHERHSVIPDLHYSSNQDPDTLSGGLLPQTGLLLHQREEIPVEIQSAPMLDEEGGVVGGILVVRDISEQIRVDAIRLQLEERLFQAQKMESLGQLAGGIAHDFNNLLTAILGNINLLKHQALPSHDKLLSATEQACSRAAELVRQLLSFGRGESDGHSDSEGNRPIDITSVLSEVVEVVEAASPTPVSIDTRIRNPIPMLMGNSSQVYQLIMNLCMNARDAVLESRELNRNNLTAQRPDILISLSRKKIPNHLRATIAGETSEVVELRVSDSGIGMTEETKRRIFEPFFTTKPVGKGTGLGLATVYGIVRRLGGAIEVDSQIGSGSTFRVLLPAPAETRHTAISLSSIAASFRGSGTLLVVDGDPVVRDIIGAMFSELGYGTLTAASASELFAILAKGQNVSAIVCSADLPDSTNNQLLEALHLQSPHIPVIMIIDRGAPSRDLAKLSQVSILQKPYKLHDLAREVSSVVSARMIGGNQPLQTTS
jgi:hypothetical protein